MNFLALNLTNEVATGKRSVDEARSEYARVVMAFMSGQQDPKTRGLQFSAQGDTRDPDRSVLTTSNR